jgi:D-threonate/D-erythronate kinase
MPTRIIVIADDLSGAAELAGIAFASGLSAEVQRQYEPSSNADVIAIDTDSRNLDEHSAPQRVRQIAQQVIDSRPAWIFKKVDSLLRGNVRAEIEALLQTTGQRRALLIPTNPSRGRVIAGGRYLIEGVPLEQTQFASDPDHPRSTADVQSLLGNDGSFPLHCVQAGEELPAEGIVVPDVQSSADLVNFIRPTDRGTLAAGAADFFAALLAARSNQPLTASRPTTLSLPPPALLVCGSLNAWPTRRKQCAAANVAVTTIDDWGNGPRTFQVHALGLSDAVLNANGSTLLPLLSAAVALIFLESSVNTLLIEGGATAAAIAQRLGWTRLSVVAAAPAGIGVLKPLASGAPLVLIKPGSYPWPGEIWQQFLACQHG